MLTTTNVLQPVVGTNGAAGATITPPGFYVPLTPPGFFVGQPKRQATKATIKPPIVGANGVAVMPTQRAAGGPRNPAQPTIYGCSAASVARWLGYHGFTYAQAVTVLGHHGATLAPVTLRTYLTDGKRADQKWGKRAVLTADAEGALFALIETPAAAAPVQATALGAA